MSTNTTAACLLVAACMALAPTRARAQTGDNASALPGIVRVGLPSAEQRPIALAGSAGYGVTESQAGEGAHHRATGSLAASIGAARFLAVGLRLDGRYDRHPADAKGSDDGWVGDPRLYARASVALSDSVRAGGELLAWLPGASAPSLVPKATTLDFKGLLAWKNNRGLELAALAGLRWDNSANAAPSNARLRAGDRLALGASDFDAVLLGVGASERLGAVEVLGELSADALVGSGAPKLLQSPIRVSGGARYHSSDALAWEVVLDASLSERPTLGPASPHIPVEPRFSIQLGARYAFSPTKPAAQPVAAPELSAPQPSVQASAALRGHVVDQDGTPVEGASVELSVAGTTRSTQSASDGSYGLEGLPLGGARVTLRGEGLEESVQSLELASPQVELDLRATRSPITGQIRGLVRSFAGSGLPAKIEVKQLSLKVSASTDGKFELDVPPGQYEVSVELSGYAGQKRSVTVEPNGVTLLNVELREHKP